MEEGVTNQTESVVETIPPVVSQQVSSEAANQPEPVASVPPPVVVAPVTHGRSFLLRQTYDRSGRTGQMLVLLDKQQHHTPMEVVHAFLPTEPGGKIARKTDRFYMGDRKITKRYLVLIMEIRVLIHDPRMMTYRLLYASGKPFREWQDLDLSMLRLRTSEAQRAMIGAFTGITYKVPEGGKEQYRKQLSQQALGNALQQAGVDPEELKRHLH